MNAAVIDALLAEMRPLVVGRKLSRARAVGAHAVELEILGARDRRLWLECSRGRAGLYALKRDDARALADPASATGRTRQAALLLRKHLEGRRITDIRRIVGERTLVLGVEEATLVLRLHGAPALTLAVNESPVATLGEGREAWPPPEPAPDREHSWGDVAPSPIEAFETAGVGLADDASRPSSWIEAAAFFLGARVRGERLDNRRRAAVAEARGESRRLSRLLAHLEQDLAGLPVAEDLRRRGEALLAAPSAVATGTCEAVIPDPRAAGTFLLVSLDPRLSAPANADRLFDRARRIERSRQRIEARLIETRRALEDARAREARALEARDFADVEDGPSPRQELREEPGAGRAPRHYLTSRGLSLLVGRGARENHQLTFAIARPEDLWFHAQDVPGAHAILRDNEGRASAEDLREAAEVAAFFSDARGHAKVDVHVTRRKHVRAARGGMGRVHVAHSDTLRVVPRDPEGRLRRR
jgi:predicted ribosome quality control (RQC) complex YloA/Tae2 family protein